MKSVFALVSFCIASLAFAGDGGYTAVSCVSDSGRTILSVFNDNYTGSAQPTTVRLIIDGQMIEYVSSNEVYDQTTDQWVSADPSAPEILWTENGFTVLQAGAQALKVSLPLAYGNAKYNATISAGYWDPRAGTEFEYYANPGAIALKCTEFYQSP